MALVSWAAPDDGGSAVTRYRVTASPGGAEVITSDASPVAVVEGLQNDTVYTFVVTATNAEGEGPASSPSSPVTPKAATFPEAPVDVAGTPRHQGVLVTWKRPLNVGGAPIMSYTITATPGGTAVEVPATVFEAPVTGLTNGTAYTFTVTANNRLGAGPASAPSSSVVPAQTVPDPPTDVSAAAGGNGSVLVSWNPPAYEGGSPITGFTVVVSPDSTTITAPPSATQVMVTGLTPGNLYFFRVRATNALGDSRSASPSVAVAPDVTVPATTHALSDAALATLTAMADDSLTFTNAPTEVTGRGSGDVLVAAASPVAPDGFLRKVVSISTTGSTTQITTQRVPLESAISQGQFTVQDMLDADDLEQLQPAPGVQLIRPLAGDISTKISFKVEVPLAPNVTGSAQVTIEPRFRFDGDLLADGQKMDASFTTDARVQLGLAAEAAAGMGARIRLAQPFTKRKVFLIGRVPVEVLFKITLFLTGSGEVKASLEFSAEESTEVTAGVRYNPFTGFQPYSSLRHAPIKIAPPRPDVEASVHLGLQLEFATRLYEVAGPQALLEDFLELANNPLGQPKCQLSRGTQMGLGFGVDWFVGGKSFNKDDLIKVTTPIWACADDPPAPPTSVAISDLRPVFELGGSDVAFIPTVAPPGRHGNSQIITLIPSDGGRKCSTDTGEPLLDTVTWKWDEDTSELDCIRDGVTYVATVAIVTADGTSKPTASAPALAYCSPCGPFAELRGDEVAQVRSVR